MGAAIRVLIIEDSEDDAWLLVQTLRDAGLDVVFERVDTARAMRAALGGQPWDVVISDYVMPQFRAPDALRILQESGLDLPFIIVSGAIGEQAAVAAMKAGAHDWVMKDSLARLAPAVERELREAAVRTQRRRAEEELRESEERYALSVRAASDGLWDWDLKANQVYFSSRWKSMLGFSESEIGNGPDEWFNRVHPEDLGRVKAGVTAHIEGVTEHFESEHRMLHRNGTYRWMLTRGLVARDAGGKAYRMAGSQSDITDRKVAEQQLIHDAFHDALTGLPNRALLIDRLGQSIARGKRRREYLFAVLFLDIDRFKVINDSLGHMSGDQLLIAMARRLGACVRPGDTVARLGGDEFGIILEDIKHVSDATRVAERVQKELSVPFLLSGQEVFAPASIGIALSATGYERPEDLLRDADMEMYHAKALGKARHEVFDPSMHAGAVALLQLENDLRRAIERGELRLQYQPIVSLESGGISGFEALLRWAHPERDLLLPAEFIAVAEETGLIIPIGWWVLREACRQAHAWRERSPANADLFISVNLSAKQFMRSDLSEQIDGILRSTGLDPRRLNLEITESVIMDNVASTSALLSQLKALDVQLQIDDFGTGYSSLSYLSRFRFDKLKIDRSFVSNMGVDAESSEIVQTIIALAGRLGMEVVAEGVEKAEQLSKLRALKCTYGQGYFFSRPVDGEAAAMMAAAGPRW
jgi:diguanylate cyclase (GGDEF)-like protein/PAS domain S-box-containing protein